MSIMAVTARLWGQGRVPGAPGLPLVPIVTSPPFVLLVFRVFIILLLFPDSGHFRSWLVLWGERRQSFIHRRGRGQGGNRDRLAGQVN